MKVLKPNEVPAEPSNSPLFTGGTVTRQPLLTPAMSNNFNLGRQLRAGARNKMHIHSSDQVLFVTAGKGMIATETHQEVITVEMSCIFRRKRNIGTGPRRIPHSPTLR